MMKRRIKQVLLLLLFGAIVNIAVAWVVGLYGIKATDTLERAFNTISDGTLVMASVEKTRCTTLVWLNPRRPLPEMRNDTWDSPEKIIPYWCASPEMFRRFNEASALHPFEYVLGQKIAVGLGWPLRSVWYVAGEHVYYGNNKYFASGALNSKQALTFNYDNLVGMKPIWSGFVVNTLFWGFALWMLFVLNPALHRRLRLKRGLCPSCKYPIGVSPVCTECGAAFMVRHSASS